MVTDKNLEAVWRIANVYLVARDAEAEDKNESTAGQRSDYTW